MTSSAVGERLKVIPPFKRGHGPSATAISRDAQEFSRYPAEVLCLYIELTKWVTDMSVEPSEMRSRSGSKALKAGKMTSV